MSRLIRHLLIANLFFSGICYGDDLKQGAVDYIDGQRETMESMAKDIWAYAELALAETRSSARLRSFAVEQGFDIEDGVAGMPTAFVASFGQGKPVIAILGEFDALPRLSQKAITSPEPLVEGGNGHGCGHNLFGVGSLGAAAAVKRMMEAGNLNGTVRFYATPAEEAIGGKIYMARDGLFDDVDIVLSWHPDSTTQIDSSGSMAMVETLVEFKGISSHAASDPWNGRSALDGLELFTHALNLWREHVKPTVRIHYAYSDGGGAPNVVPATAAAPVWIRDIAMPDVLPLLERMKQMAEGAALATNTEVKVSLLSGTYNLIHNKEVSKVIHANMLALPPIEYTEEEIEFARALQTAMGKDANGLVTSVKPLNFNPTEVTGGSTDTADVSWIAPTVEFSQVTAPADIPWHSWAVVASSGNGIGMKGMMQAAKTISMTAIDYLQDPGLVTLARQQLEADIQGNEYRAYLPPGPPPVPE